MNVGLLFLLATLSLGVWALWPRGRVRRLLFSRIRAHVSWIRWRCGLDVKPGSQRLGVLEVRRWADRF